MIPQFFVRLLCCIFFFGVCLYSYLGKQNIVTDLRIRLPRLAKEIEKIREKNARLQYEIDQFENPIHLIELARHSEFSHLKHPLLKEILNCPEGYAVAIPSVDKPEVSSPVKSKSVLATAIH
jgi:hypothetical protein